MSAFAWSQILAGLTLVTGMAAFQFRAREHILRGWCLAALFAAVHFFLLGANEAGCLVLVTATRFLVSSLTTERRWMIVFIGLAIASFAWSYSNPVGFLGLAATLISTVGSFYGTERAVRVAMMATEVLWAIHNWIIWSPVAVLMEFAFLASNLVGLLRHRRAKETAL